MNEWQIDSTAPPRKRQDDVPAVVAVVAAEARGQKAPGQAALAR
jgi:hypothetical protein